MHYEAILEPFPQQSYGNNQTKTGNQTERKRLGTRRELPVSFSSGCDVFRSLRLDTRSQRPVASVLKTSCGLVWLSNLPRSMILCRLPSSSLQAAFRSPKDPSALSRCPSHALEPCMGTSRVSVGWQTSVPSAVLSEMGITVGKHQCPVLPSASSSHH